MSEALPSKALQRALRRATGASQITDLDVLQPVWGGNGQVMRVELAGASVERVVVKHITLPAGTKRKKRIKDASVARTVASYDNELTFYQRYASPAKVGLKMPHFFGGQTLEDGWLFILEDLESSTWVRAKKAYDEPDLRAALNWLADFHARYLGHSAEGLWKAGSYWNWASRKDEASRMVDTRLKTAAAALDSALNQCRFKTLIHGDAKTDNFCFSKETGGPVAAIDFQYVGPGCAMKDVMCLLDSSLDPHSAQSQAPRLLDYYFDRLRCALREEAAPDRQRPEGGLNHEERSAIDVQAVEDEWRSLYPVAWADYYRFLDGWAPGKYPPFAYVQDMVGQAVAHLSRG